MNLEKIAGWSFIVLALCSMLYLQFASFSRKSDVKPPTSIKLSVVIEGFFGTLLIGFSILLYYENPLLGLFLFIVALTWFYVTINVYMAKKWAKIAILILSGIRCMTLVGIIFSLPTMYLLYKPRFTSDFFNNVEVNEEAN